jgi:hypothetical protein
MAQGDELIYSGINGDYDRRASNNHISSNDPPPLPSATLCRRHAGHMSDPHKHTKGLNSISAGWWRMVRTNPVFGMGVSK